MSENILEAKHRLEKGRKTDYLRAQGLVPGVVYGVDTEPQMITLDRNQLVKMYRAAGESSVIELKIDNGEALHVLIQDYQLDPLRNDFTHVDFRSIDMTKEIEAEVDLEFIGESAAVKGLGGTLVRSRDTIAVRCLPTKLVRSISVDISVLATFDDVVRISDLNLPEGVVATDDAELTIAVVSPPRSEAEMEALDAAVEENVGAVGDVEDKKEDSEDGETSEEKTEGNA